LDDGIPELQVPSLNPLIVPELIFTQTDGINVQAIFRNIEIGGCTKFRLRNVRADTKTDKFRMKVWFPEFVMKGQYDIQGMLLALPIRGNGDAYGNFSESKLSYKFLVINYKKKLFS
jgi:hypothetical protein